MLLQSKYKEASKKEMQSGSFTTLPETRDTAHSKEVNKLISGVQMFSRFFTRAAQQSHDLLLVLTFLPLLTETVQAELREGEGQVNI